MFSFVLIQKIQYIYATRNLISSFNEQTGFYQKENEISSFCASSLFGRRCRLAAEHIPIQILWIICYQLDGFCSYISPSHDKAIIYIWAHSINGFLYDYLRSGYDRSDSDSQSGFQDCEEEYKYTKKIRYWRFEALRYSGEIPVKSPQQYSNDSRECSWS